MNVDEREHGRKGYRGRIVWVFVAVAVFAIRVFPLVLSIFRNTQPQEQWEMLSLLAVLCSAFLLLGLVIRAIRK